MNPKKYAYMPYFDPDEFIELLVKYHDGKATKQEIKFIEQQFKENEQARDLWQDVLVTFAAEDNVNGHTLTRRYKRPLPHWLAAAAILLVFIVGDSLYLFLHKRQLTLPKANYEKAIILQMADGHVVQLSKKPLDSLAHLAKMPVNHLDIRYSQEPNTLTVPKGFTYALELADSTKVYVNADTDLKFPFSFHSSRREVFVEGEAYFDVAPDPGRPFVVHTKHADVIALGTSFNVSTYNGYFKAALLTGAVVVMEKNKMIQLSPGQAAVKDQESGELVVDTFTRDTVPGWVNGRYVFEKKSLAEVCATIERLYDVKIVFDRKEIGKLTYTGAVSKKQKVEEFLADVEKVNKIKYYRDKEQRIHLK
jgi:hypothetical protein